MATPKVVGGRWLCEQCGKAVAPTDAEFWGERSIHICCGEPVWQAEWAEEPQTPLGDRSRISPLAE